MLQMGKVHSNNEIEQQGWLDDNRREDRILSRLPWSEASMDKSRAWLLPLPSSSPMLGHLGIDFVWPFFN
jgi:hypothetical protein